MYVSSRAESLGVPALGGCNASESGSALRRADLAAVATGRVTAGWDFAVGASGLAATSAEPTQNNSRAQSESIERRLDIGAYSKSQCRRPTIVFRSDGR